MDFGKYRGFNFQWLIDWSPGARPKEPDERALDFLVKHGFNFVRIPTNYWFWCKDFDYFHPDESVFDWIDTYLHACQARGMHMSLNMHRVPGYCINRPEIEKHNLWTDPEPLEALEFYWRTMAKRFAGVPSDDLSFDLINEPPAIGELGFDRDVHQKVIRRLVASIRTVDPSRTIVIDGLDGGHVATPELADLGAVHSGRGYQPMTVSHYGAEWWAPAKAFSTPVYPGGSWNGVVWNRNSLSEFYEPWKAMQRAGTQIHIGECGCYNKTPEDVAKRWLTDLFSLFREFGWGYALWNFEGSFGIIGHGRAGAEFEMVDGYLVDRELLEILKGD